MNIVIIEQTNDYPKRMKFNPENNTFFETEWDSLAYIRGVTFPYGWLKDSGTPPEEHLDVILVTRKPCSLGDELPIKIIGVFKRNDGDHKLVAVSPERCEADFYDLPETEKDELYKLYPLLDKGEGWFGVDIARNIINDFEINGRVRL